jgi:hypothetical protein
MMENDDAVNDVSERLLAIIRACTLALRIYALNPPSIIKLAPVM